MNSPANLKAFANRLDLRSWAIDRWMPNAELDILDIGAGEGAIWESLKWMQQHSYFPVDKKPKLKGTLEATVTGEFLARLNLSKYNIIDIDLLDDAAWELYSWACMLVRTPTIIFVTVSGKSSKSKMQMSNEAKMALGIDLQWKNVPVTAALVDMSNQLLLARGYFRARAVEPILSFGPVSGVRGYAVKCEAKS